MYLESFKFNPRQALAVSSYLKSLRLEKHGQSALREFYSSEEKVMTLVKLLVENSNKHFSYNNSSEPFESGHLELVVSNLHKIFGALGWIFAPHASAIAEYLESKELFSLTTSEGRYFRKKFFNPKFLKKTGGKSQQILDCMTQEAKESLEYLSPSDYSNSCKDFFSKGVSILDIALTEPLVDRLFKHIWEDGHTESDQIGARLWIKLLFRKKNTPEEFDYILKKTKGLLDKSVKLFHRNFARTQCSDKIQNLVRLFIDSYSSEVRSILKKHPENESLKTIREHLRPVLKKIINFLILAGKGTFAKEKFFNLISTDFEEFANFSLEKIHELFNKEEEKSRPEIYGWINTLVQRIPNYEDLSMNHLGWIIPKLLNNLENADVSTAAFIYQIFADIFEEFAGIEEDKSAPEYLTRMVSDIEEAGIRLLEFMFKKKETFNVNHSVLINLSDISSHLKSKIKEHCLSALRNDLTSIYKSSFFDIIRNFSYLFPEDFEEEVFRIASKVLLFEAKEPRELSSLTFGSFLKKLDIKEVTYSLGASNDDSLLIYLTIVQGILLVGCEQSQRNIRLLLTFLVLAMEHDEEKVVSGASLVFKELLSDTWIDIKKLPKRRLYLETLKEEDHQKKIDEQLVWSFIFEKHKDKSKLLVNDIFLETIRLAESFMKSKIDEEYEFSSDLKVQELYKLTLEEPEEKEKLTRKTLKPLTTCISILNSLSSNNTVLLALLTFPQLRTLLKNFKARLAQYALTSKAFFNIKFREEFLLFLADPRKVFSSMRVGFSNPKDKARVKEFRKVKYWCSLLVSMGYLSAMVESCLPILMSQENLLGFDFNSLTIPKELEGFIGSKTLEDPGNNNLFIFGGELEDYFRCQPLSYLTQLLVLSTLFSPQSGSNYTQKICALSYSVTYSPSLLSQVQNLRGIFALPQSGEDKYSKLAVSLNFTLLSHMRLMVTEPEEIDQILDFCLELAKKSVPFALTSGIISKLIAYSSIIPAGKPHSDQDCPNRLAAREALQTIVNKTDAEVSAMEVFCLVTKSFLRSKFWGPKECALAVAAGIACLGSDDINKVSVGMNLLLFVNLIVRDRFTTTVEHKIDYHQFANSEGLVTPEMTQKVFNEVKHRLGFSDQTGGEFTESQKTELDKFNEDLLPARKNVTMIANLSFPLIANSVKLGQEVKKEFDSLLASTEGLKDRLEASSLKVVNYWALLEPSTPSSQIAIGLGLTHFRLWISKPAVVQKETLRTRTLEQIFTYLGFDLFGKMIETLKSEVKTESQNSQYHHTLLILYSGILYTAASLTDDQFSSLLEKFKHIFKEYFNSILKGYFISVRHRLNNFYAFTMSFKRIKLFLNTALACMKENPRDLAYFLAFFNYSIASYSLVSSIAEENCKEAAKLVFESLKEQEPASLDMDSVTYLSEYFYFALSMRYSSKRSWMKEPKSLEVCLKKLNQYQPESEVFEWFKTLFQKVQNASEITKAQALRAFPAALSGKYFKNNYFDTLKYSLDLLLSLDTLKDESASTIIKQTTLMIRKNPGLKSGFDYEDFPDELFEYLQEKFTSATTNNNLPVLQIILEILAFPKPVLLPSQDEATGKPKPAALENFLLTISAESRTQLQDVVNKTLKLVFSELSDLELFEYCEKRIFKAIDKNSLLISKIKDKKDENYKRLSKEIEQWANLLINVIASRTWQLNTEIEKCLKYLVKAKRNSTEASKKFDNFVTNYWSKQQIMSYNDHELPEEIQDELNNFNSPYFYHS